MNMTSCADWWLNSEEVSLSLPSLTLDLPDDFLMDGKQQKRQEQLVKISEDQGRQESLFQPSISEVQFPEFEVIETLSSENEEQSQNPEKDVELNLNLENFENLFENNTKPYLEPEIPSSNCTCTISPLKKDQVVNRNLASADKKEKAHLVMRGVPNAKSVKLVIIYTGKFEIGETKYDYSTQPLELPEHFLEPSTFPTEGKEEIYINKAKFLKEGNVGQLYSFMETKHNCRTPRLKDHPFKKNLGLRVQVYDDKNTLIKIWDFPNMFTLDGHRDKWKASKKSVPPMSSSPKFEESQSNHGSRVKSCLNEANLVGTKRGLEQRDSKKKKIKLEQISSQ